MAQKTSTHRMFRPFHSLLRRKEVVAVDLTLEVRNLIERGHDPGEVDEKGQSAIHVCATIDGPVEVLRLLVEQVDAVVLNKRDGSSMTPLHCLLDRDRVVDPACLKCLVEAGASLTSVSKSKGTPLECLCRHSNGVGDLFQCLLCIALSVLRRERESLLKTAFREGSAAFLEVFLSHWHSLSGELWMNSFAKPVYNALSSSRDAEAKADIAISYGADPSIEAWPMRETLAHRAAALASIPLLNAAHVHGIDLSLKDDYGRTPLHIAVDGGPEKQAVVDFLIENSVDLNTVNDDGVTALEKAIGESTRNIDAAISLIRAGGKLPTTEVPYDVAVALSDSDVIARSVNPILTALEVAAFVKRASRCVAPSEKSTWRELSDSLVNFASDLATVSGSEVIERSIFVALKNNQKKFLCNSKVEVCLGNLFVPPSLRRRRLRFPVVSFFFSLFMLYVRFVSFPFVLLFYILPRYKRDYAAAADDFLVAESRRHGLVILYATHGISHLYFSLLFYLGSGETVAPAHFEITYLSKLEWLIIVQVVGKVAYGLGQLRRQSVRGYFKEIGNRWDVAVILVIIVGLCIRLHIMTSGATYFAASFLSVLYALLFLTASFRVLFYLILFPHFGPMLISFRKLVYPLISFVFFFVVVLISFAISFKNIYEIKAFKSLSSCSVTEPSSTSPCPSELPATNSSPSLSNIVRILFLSTVNLASASDLGLGSVNDAEGVFHMIWAVFWLVASSIILLNILIALISNAYQNAEGIVGTDWGFLKAEIIASLYLSPIVPPPFNLFAYFGLSVAYIVSFLGRWEKEKTGKVKVEVREELRRSDLTMRENLLTAYKASVEEKELDEPVTKRDLDAINLQIKEIRETIQILVGIRESSQRHVNSEENATEWVADRLHRRLSSLRRNISRKEEGTQ